MSEHTPPPARTDDDGPGTPRKLVAVLLGLTAVVVLMLCAFALPSVNGGPHRVPVGVTGPRPAAQALQEKLDGPEWDVTVYGGLPALSSAVEEREIAGGLALTADRIDLYTATAGAPTATGALTALGNSVADRQRIPAAVHDLVPYPEDDPRGAGFAAAGLPLIFGGIFPAVVLTRLFPGHAGLRTRFAGVVLFSLLAGAAVTAFLQYGTGSLDGSYWVTALALSLGMAALSMTFIGLEALAGFAGLGAGAAVMMLLGNPLSGLGSGPYWLPSGWAAFGQLLPPGASGSLLRANAFFDGTGATGPALVLAGWVAVGLVLLLIADRRNRSTRPGAAAAEPRTAAA
ncbi:hypothetical protein DMH02_027875 [Streptomyces sp. WAC 00631]|uniref:hypothetical protein n=1 Tax=Streptomyces sp. WAC 00631 TaxID=2203201 RepID=UPI001E3C1202|nr:hypothetical protein [Streptomyces sp. WAC 00631]MCC5036888.1 hypothetical protein [Streptomyces sp. WAC 00631]